MLTDPSYAVLSTMSRVAGPFTRCPGDKLPAIRDWEPRATTDPDRIRVRRCLDGGAGQRRVGVWACRPRRGRPLLRAGLSARRAVTSAVCGPGRWPAGW